MIYLHVIDFFSVIIMTDEDKDKERDRNRDEFPLEDLFKAFSENLNRWFESFGSDPQRIDEMVKKFLSNPFVMGWNVSVGPDGMPKFQRFGNKPNAPRFTSEREKEPLIDVYDQGDTIRVIAEVPGVSKDSIKVRTEEKMLHISANQDQRRYAKTITLPCAIIPESAQAKYNYGVLEVTLKKVKPSSDNSGVDIPVE